MTSKYTDQVGFRFHANDSVGLNTDGDWLANQNVNGSMDVDTTFRVRFEVEEQNNKNTVVQGQLEAKLNTGSWFSVGAATSIVKAVASAQFNTDDPTTNLLTASAKSFVTGYGTESGLSTSVSIQNEQTEFEYSIQIVGADVSNDDVIYLQIQSCDAYSAAAQVTVIKGAASFQAAWARGSNQVIGVQQ